MSHTVAAAATALGHDARAAAAFFTRLPTGGSAAAIRPGRVILHGPGIGLALGLVAAAIAGIVGSLVAQPGAAVLSGISAVAAAAYLTRGLHLDGLADFADGLGADRSPQESVAIMQRSDIGPFGVITLVLVLMLQVAGLALLDAGGPFWLGPVIALPAGRVAIAWLCRPALAAAPGSRLGAWVAQTVATPHAAAASLLWAAGAALLAGLATGSAAAGAAGALAVAAACGCGAVVGRIAVRRFGGITGDVLGAAVELGQTAALLVLVVALV